MLYHILSNENSDLLKIDNIGFSGDPKICRFGPGQRDLYLIHYVVSGEGVFNGNPLKAGQGFLITPHTYECYYPDKDNPWKLLWVTSRDAAVEEIFDAYNANPQTQIFEYNYADAAERLTHEIEKKHNSLCSATEILEIFLNLFNRQKRKSGYENSEELYFNYAMNYIELNVSRSLSVAELTQILGVSQPYLYKIFMKKCSVSPKRYIDNVKIQKAKALLAETDMQISEVAYSVGFENQLRFSAFFKQRTGMSPTDFRICEK